MVHLRHRRGELLCVERHDSPDMRLSTALEMGGLRRYVTGHLRVIAAVSPKLADRVMRLSPGEPYIVGNLFTFSTLEQAVKLIYTGHIILDEEASEDGIDLLASWGAKEILCSHLGGPRRSS